MTLLPAFAIVAVVTASLRLVPGLLWQGRNKDSGYHMLLRREIRRNGMRMPPRVPAMMLDERQTYPWAFHWLLALLPESWLQRTPPLPSTIVDVAHAGLVFGLAAYLAQSVSVGLAPPETGLLAGLLFATAPALLVVGIGPRAYEITPRPFGEFLFSALMVAIGGYGAGGSPWLLVLAAVVGGVLCLSSKFSLQVLVLTAPVVAALSREWIVLALPVAAVATALLLSRGRYWWVLRAQVSHLSLYYHRLQHDHPMMVRRNQWRSLGTSLWRVIRTAGRDSGLLADFVRVAEHNTWLQLLLRNAIWLAAGLLAMLGLIGSAPPPVGGWERWLAIWAVALLLPFALSSLHRFKFLGEAERYPEYGIAAITVLVAIGAAALPPDSRRWFLLAYAVFTIPVLLYSLLRQRWNSRRARGAEIDELADYLLGIRPGTVVLPIPWYAAFVLAPLLDLRFLVSNDGMVWGRDYDRLFVRYPWPSTDLNWWRRNHGAELILTQLDLVKVEGAQGLDYDLGGLHELFDNGTFRVYAFADDNRWGERTVVRGGHAIQEAK